MSSNTKKKVTEYLLTKKQISAGLYEPNEVYYIKDSGKELGPFWQEDLKEFIDDYGLLNQNVLAKSLNDSDWTPVTSHPLFQRRRPEIVKEFKIDEDDQFFLLKNGKKDGPFTSNEVNAKLDKLEVLHTDLVSVDNGISWGTIYEFEVFDRRTRDNQSLPESPQGHVFQNSMLDADRAMAVSKKDQGDREFIYDLAYIGNQKLNPNKPQIDDFEQKEQTDNTAMFRLAAFAFSFIVVAAVFFTFSNFSGSPEPVAKKPKVQRTKRTPAAKKRTQPKVQERPKPTKKPTTRIKKKKEAPKREITRSDRPLNKGSFLSDTREMTDGQMDPRDLPPEVIFDDNSEALELDPIRERISKETFDPQQEELENYDELDAAREIVDDYLERSPAAGGQEEFYEDEFVPEDAIEGSEY